MHAFAVGHGYALGENRAVEVGHERLFNLVAEGGNVHAVELYYFLVKFFRRAAVLQIYVGDVRVDTFAVADKDDVDKVGKGFGVDRARSADCDYGIIPARAFSAR